MAKSSRSKWKKTHRRLRAQAEKSNTQHRLKRLNKKLKITVKGGISAVPPEDPETRFHFLNPAFDPRVPNTRANLNNNFKHELQPYLEKHKLTSIDFSKPLTLEKRTTNFYGKTDTTAPHPMTVNFEVLDADAPVAGQAFTMDHVDFLQKQKEDAAAAKAAKAAELEAMREARRLNKKQSKEEKKKDKKDNNNNNNNNNNNEEDDEAIVNFDTDPMLMDADNTEPEEYVFTMEDTAPRRVSSKTNNNNNNNVVAADVMKAALKDSSSSKAHKIESMEKQTKRHNVVVSTAGDKKLKQLNKVHAPNSRMVSSGSKAAAAAKKKKK